MTHAPHDKDAVAAVRSTSRQLVRELGFLTDGSTSWGLSHTQCHALIEIEREGPIGTAVLAQRLCLDESSVSRCMSTLEGQGLVERRRDPEDGRRKPIQLTRQGRERLAKVHAAVDEQVRDALEGLPPEKCDVIIEGMALYGRALSAQRQRQAFEVRDIQPGDDPGVAELIRQVMTSFGACGPGYAITDRAVDHMFEAYAGPKSRYMVIVRRGRVVGGGGIAPLSGDASGGVCELQKMYFQPECRGCGLGRRLLSEMITTARRFGYQTMYLETLERMHDARRLYESFGFRALHASMGDTGHYACDRQYALGL